MASYDKKIEQYSKKVEQFERNIKHDTEERKRLISEISRLRYLSLCEKLNCDGEMLESEDTCPIYAERTGCQEKEKSA